eukprot:scaffold86846_cov45-Phaeocystis_antarctica.AAC.1
MGAPQPTSPRHSRRSVCAEAPASVRPSSSSCSGGAAVQLKMTSYHGDHSAALRPLARRLPPASMRWARRRKR